MELHHKDVIIGLSKIETADSAQPRKDSMVTRHFFEGGVLARITQNMEW